MGESASFGVGTDELDIWPVAYSHLWRTKLVALSPHPAVYGKRAATCVSSHFCVPIITRVRVSCCGYISQPSHQLPPCVCLPSNCPLQAV